MLIQNKSIFVAALTVIANVAFAGITIESEVKYEQVVSTGGATQSLTDGAGPIAADLAQTYNTANAEYKFETDTSTTSPFELKSEAKLEVDIDGRGTNLGWNSVSASARSVSGLVDTAIIDGAPGQVGGVVEFLWTVTGTSTIELNRKIPSDAYFIDDLATVAIFNPSEGDGLFTEVFEHDQGNQTGPVSIDSEKPGFFGPQVFAVDWFAGQDFDVFFELTTVARLKVTNLDAAGFNALVDADFSNTATLDQIRIYDNAGNLLPDATITSRDAAGPDYSSQIVPEPSSFTLAWALSAILSGSIRNRKRRA